MQPTPFTTTIFSGLSFYTSTSILPDGQQEIEVIEPATTTTTIISGTSFYTSTTILPDGQTELQIIEPATTTVTSYTATTTIFTATNTGSNGQVTVQVVEPTPGMQFFGFQGDPKNFGTPDKPDSSEYANDAANIDVKGVFPGDINLYTDATGEYQFPGQASSTNASNYVVVFEGYFYGPPGDYGVTLSTETDDYSFLWCDQSAYSGWTDDNSYITESIAGNYTQVHTFTLAEGEFVPMTIMWFNVYQSGGVRFFIYPPGGAEINDTTGWFVQPYTGDGFKYSV